MRLHLFALVFCTVTLTRNTDSSRVRGLSVAETNLSISGLSADDRHDGDPVKRPLGRLHGTMPAEERAPPPVLGTDEKVIKTAAAALVVTLHSHDVGTNALTKSVRTQLESIDMDTMELHLKRLCGGHEVKHPATSVGVHEYGQLYERMITESEHTRNQVLASVYSSLKIHQLEIAKDMEAKREEWVQAKVHPDDVFTELSIAGDVGSDGILINPFASPNLEVLKAYILLYNGKINTHVTLLDTFIKGFGGEDKLAAVLWTAKVSPFYRVAAQDMQGELLHKLLESGMKTDDVGMSAKTKRVLAYQQMGMVTGSALLLEISRLGETYICDSLIKRPGHHDFAMLLGYARLVNMPLIDELEKELFSRWVMQGVRPIAPGPVKAGASLAEEIEASMIERYVTFHDKNVALLRPAALHGFFPHPSRANQR
uniref:RxLR effector candidate protein n=1 Tax=Peronospora matthiolae TaxID=2874970 RepID=A0AAV1UP51_9STRA